MKIHSQKEEDLNELAVPPPISIFKTNQDKKSTDSQDWHRERWLLHLRGVSDTEDDTISRMIFYIEVESRMIKRKARRVAVVNLYMLRMYSLIFFLVFGLTNSPTDITIGNTSLPYGIYVVHIQGYLMQRRHLLRVCWYSGNMKGKV